MAKTDLIKEQQPELLHDTLLDVDLSTEERVQKVENFYNNHKNSILYIVGGLLAAVLLWVGYNNFIKAPNESKANDAIERAQTYMMMDSTNWVLNGDGANMGVVKIASKFSGTKAGNTANYMAGVCYLKNGDYKNAIKYLKEFNGNGTILATEATGLLGDAYWENGDLENAVTNYEKAGTDEKNLIFAPTYLFRAGLVYEKQNKTDKAIAAYKKVKSLFPQSPEARDIDKYLARLGDVTE